MQIKLSEKSAAPIVMGIIAMIIIVLQVLSTGVSGETDSVFHYQLARYAFKYPEFFLSHWGKPLFTILISPFAQLGYTGALAFNMICGMLSGWFAYLIARRLGYKHAWAAIIFTVFTPLYLFNMYSSLTEILFSLVLIISIYLFISKRFIFSAIIISLIPFARTEGVMFVALFLLALLWMKQYKALPFLLTGFLVFSLAGVPLYHDFFWFITKMPYSTASAALYGSGSFWTYFSQMDYILNYPLLILIITGLVIIILGLGKGFKNLRDIKYATLYFLIIPGIFGFLLAQSFLWWRGLGILASMRFMSCILPLCAILAVTGFEGVMQKARSIRIFYILLGVWIIGMVVIKPFSYKVLPNKTGINFAVMEQLTNWLKTSPYATHRTLYTDPMFPFYMNVDPFDSEKNCKVYSYENINPASKMKDGDLLIWDTQFAGYEGHLPLNELMSNDSLRLLNIFTPIEHFTVIGGQDYQLAVFMKAPRDSSRLIYNQFYYNNFENHSPEGEKAGVVKDFSNSGMHSILMTPEYIYSPSAQGKLSDLPGKSTISLKASAQVFSQSPEDKDQINIVITVEDSNQKIYRYTLGKVSDSQYKPGEWFAISQTEVIDRNVPVDGRYKVYIWYTGKNRIYIDDLKLEYFPVAYE